MKNKKITAMLYQNPHMVVNQILDQQENLQLSAQQLMVLLYLWLIVASGNVNPSHQLLAEKSALSVAEIRKTLSELQKKQLFHLELYQDEITLNEQYDMSPLFEVLFDEQLTTDKQPSNQLQNFIQKTEREFGRMLSPIEIQYLQSEIYDRQIPIDLLYQALEETVLSGIKNFKYMAAILRNWQDNQKNDGFIQRRKQQKDNQPKSFSNEEKEAIAYDWTKNLGEDDNF